MPSERQFRGFESDYELVETITGRTKCGLPSRLISISGCSYLRTVIIKSADRTLRVRSHVAKTGRILHFREGKSERAGDMPRGIATGIAFPDLPARRNFHRESKNASAAPRAGRT
jgi:hypothetical protein